MKGNYSVPKVVRSWIWRITFTYGNGIRATKETSNYMRLILEAWFAIVIDLSSDTRLVCNVVNTVDNINITSLGKDLKSIDRCLKQVICLFDNFGQLIEFPDYTTFKQLCTVELGWRFYAPLKGFYNTFRDNMSGQNMFCLLTYVNFLGRCNPPDLDYTFACEQEYIHLEEHYPDVDVALATEMSVHVPKFLLKNLDGCQCRHGNGSTVEVSRRNACSSTKDSFLGVDERLGFVNNKYVHEDIPVGSVPDTSEIQLVPKSMVTFRTISREPTSLQYFQQYVREALIAYVSDTWLSDHYFPSEQERSKDLAREGSVFGEFATIDLSEASDRVSLVAVRALFRKEQALLQLLLLTRSKYTKMPSGVILPLKKFAPMGSATCFPVESIFFCICCKEAENRFNLRTNASLHSRFVVYGDDIVIEDCLVDDLLQILEALGCKVNYDKSFFHTVLLNYREACGGEYLNGQEVTPVRVPRFFCRRETYTHEDGGCITGIIAFCNKLRQYQCYGAWNVIFGELCNTGFSKLVPWSSRVDLFALTTEPEYLTNYKLKFRRHPATQSREVLCLANVARTLAGNDESRYRLWLKASTRRQSCWRRRFTNVCGCWYDQSWNRWENYLPDDVPGCTAGLSSSKLRTRWVSFEMLANI